jgi:site-specific recombinase XerD
VAELTESQGENLEEKQPIVFEAALPAVIEDAGAATAERFLEFFAAQIRNPNTRKAYGRAVGRFLAWCESQGLGLREVSPIAVSAYIERHDGAPATVKQHLAAIRKLFDWLVLGHIIDVNPADPVRGPKHVVEEGSTPILTAEEARELIEGLPTATIKDKRDKAIIGVLTYTFARVSAVTRLTVGDYFQAGRRWRVRLHEKGGKRRDIPLNHKAKDYLDIYIEAAGIAEERKNPLFRTITRSKALSDRPISRTSVLRMLKSRAEEAGFDPDRVCCHTFRGTGITAYLENGGKLEVAQHIAGHADASTTKLYDRRRELVNQEEVEKIGI